MKDVISTSTPGGVAGFIAETIQGVGGSVPLADGYLPAVYDVSVQPTLQAALQRSSCIFSQKLLAALPACFVTSPVSCSGQWKLCRARMTKALTNCSAVKRRWYERQAACA